MSMELSIQIAKFKFPQYELRAVTPNLMLAKVTRYMVSLILVLVSICNRASGNLKPNKLHLVIALPLQHGDEPTTS